MVRKGQRTLGGQAGHVGKKGGSGPKSTRVITRLSQSTGRGAQGIRPSPGETGRHWSNGRKEVWVIELEQKNPGGAQKKGNRRPLSREFDRKTASSAKVGPGGAAAGIERFSEKLIQPEAQLREDV